MYFNELAFDSRGISHAFSKHQKTLVSRDTRDFDMSRRVQDRVRFARYAPDAQESHRIARGDIENSPRQRFTTTRARKDKVSENNADLPLPQEIPIGITFERSAGFSDLDVPASLIPPLINRN